MSLLGIGRKDVSNRDKTGKGIRELAQISLFLYYTYLYNFSFEYLLLLAFTNRNLPNIEYVKLVTNFTLRDNYLVGRITANFHRSAQISQFWRILKL